jgi:chorismate synthase
MNSFGRMFRVSIYGESHGKGVGVLIDGCPAGISINAEDFMKDLARRKAGGAGSTKRIESDEPVIISGICDGHTTGAPINIHFINGDTRSKDYNLFRRMPRPGHSDFVAMEKYNGNNDIRGGGHFSGRLTLALVAAGVVAKKILAGSKIEAKLIQVGEIDVRNHSEEDINSILMDIQESGDSIGGIVEFSGENLPVGLGEPFFGSVESHISSMIFSVPAVKGIEFGAGFSGVELRGSQHNDSIIDASGKTATNNNGGVNGGITNGNPVVFRAAIKPTPSIYIPQETFNFETGKMDTLQINGRHDACIAKRATVVIENAAAIALADLFLINKSSRI